MTLCFPEVPLGPDVYCLDIPADMVIHIEKSEMMRLVVEIDIVGMIADVVDKMSADVARSYGSDGGGKGKRKPNLGGRAAGRLNTRGKTRNLFLKEIRDTKGPVPIQFELRDKQTVMPLGDHAANWSSYIGEVIRGVPLYYPSWLKFPKERKAALIIDIGTHFDLRPHMESPDWTEINKEMRRLEATGTYTDDEINRLARGGKQRGHILGVGRFKSGDASGSGRSGDDEEGADDQDDEDEDGDGDTYDISPGNVHTCIDSSTHKEAFPSDMSFPGDMSPGNMCHRGTNFLTVKYVGPTVSLGIVAGEGIPCERYPANIPRRQVSGETYPQRQVVGESQELSLRNGLNVIITKATIREALRLDDVESIDCLPSEEIFTELSRMGYQKPSTKLTFYKRTSWNEFSSSMASAIICLSTCRKFNFFKAQVGDLSFHTTKYSSPVLTQKVFANIRRVGKGFYGVDTPLFEGMIVAQQADDVADKGAASVDVDVVHAAADKPSIPSPTPTTSPPPPSQELPLTLQVLPTPPPSPIAQPPSPQQQPQPSYDAEISLDLLYTLLETCTTLIRRVEHLEQDKIAQTLEIIKLKQGVKNLERRNKLKLSKLMRMKKGGIIANIDADEIVTLKDVAAVENTAEIEENANVLSMQDDELEPAELKEVMEVVSTTKLMAEVVTTASTTITAATTLILVAIINVAPSASRRRQGVVIRDPEETATHPSSYILNLNPKTKEKGFCDRASPKKGERRKCYDEVSSIEEEATNRSPSQKNMMIYLTNMAGFKIDYFKGMCYDDIRPIFEKKFNSNVAFLEKTKEQMEEEDNIALKRKTKSFEEKAAKKQKLDEEVEELKKHLQIVPNNDDDVYTEATPLALKVPDDEAYARELEAELNKTIDWDDLIDQVQRKEKEENAMMRNMAGFEMDYFKKMSYDDIRPIFVKYFNSNVDFLEKTKEQMEEEDNKALKRACESQAEKVAKKQKLDEEMILLVEKIYPLTRFTLDQTLNNVKLQVEEESEVSLELLRFVRQQRQEGFRPE
nr:acidic leucine-rich nuclear phosphoprotein 32 family member A [Tanacetum cinerariifolium]